LDKIQIIEKLFLNIVIYSYLILPLLFILLNPKKKEVLIVAFYGILIFFALLFFNDVPKSFKPLFVCAYTLIEYSFFALLLFLNIQNRKYKKIIILLSFLFAVFQVIYLLTVHIGRLDTVPIGIETILLFIYIFILFYENFKNPRVNYLYGNHSFWIAVGILIYLGGSFFFNILVNHITKEQLSKYLYLTYFPEIIKNVLFAIAIVIYIRKPIKNLSNQQSSVPYLDMI